MELDFGDRLRSPLRRLEGLFASLRRAGSLQSQRGVQGGYLFARPADQGAPDLPVMEPVPEGWLADPESDHGLVCPGYHR